MPRERERSTQSRERHEAKVTKTSSAKIGGVDVKIRETEDRIPVEDIQDIRNPARIRVSAGVTQPMERQFEMIRVDVAVEWPCEPTKKAARKCYDKISAMVDEWLDEEREFAKERMS